MPQKEQKKPEDKHYERMIELESLNKLKDEKIEMLKEKISILEKQLEDKKAQTNPQDGPGPACQAYKLHKGEAIRDSDMKFVKNDKDEYISNCRSMYTKEFEYKGPKPIGSTEYPILKAHLCKNHAHTLLGKPLD